MTGEGQTKCLSLEKGEEGKLLEERSQQPNCKYIKENKKMSQEPVRIS